MKALTYETFGDASEVVRLSEQPAPEPGPGQVRLRLVASPIHTHDLATISGHYGYKPKLPAIPGTEALGIVDAVGEGVADISPGMRMVTASAHGAWAEHYIAAAGALVAVPKAIPDGAAAQLIAMPLSAYAVLDELKLHKGAWLAQTAANGTVGRILDMLAKRRGIHVLNLVRSAEAASVLTAAGVQNVVATDAADWMREAQSITGDAPIVAALDSLGGEVAANVLALLAPRGVFVSFGALSKRSIHVDPGLLIARELVIRGFWATAWTKRASPETLRFAMHDLIAGVADGSIRLDVEGEYSLDDYASAFAHWAKAGKAGKLLFRS